MKRGTEFGTDGKEKQDTRPLSQPHGAPLAAAAGCHAWSIL